MKKNRIDMPRRVYDVYVTPVCLVRVYERVIITILTRVVITYVPVHIIYTRLRPFFAAAAALWPREQ